MSPHRSPLGILCVLGFFGFAAAGGVFRPTSKKQLIQDLHKRGAEISVNEAGKILFLEWEVQAEDVTLLVPLASVANLQLSLKGGKVDAAIWRQYWFCAYRDCSS